MGYLPHQVRPLDFPRYPVANGAAAEPGGFHSTSAGAGRSPYPVPRNPRFRPYPSNRRITSVVFAPPKPNELLITTSSGWMRAVWGT